VPCTVGGAKACSLGRIWLISHGLLVNEHYFSLIPNQSIVFLVMTYKLNQPKRTGQIASASLAHHATFYLWAPKRQQKASDRIQSREMFEDATPIPVGFLDRSMRVRLLFLPEIHDFVPRQGEHFAKF